jgi:hypothetical protein
MCFYKNSHYSPGQSFNDSCQLCICSEALEVECSDRCTHKVNDLVPSDCTLIKDPKDECCKILDCETRIQNTTSIIDLKSSHNITNNNSSHLSPMPKPIDGCVHNNQTYTEGDVFVNLTADYNVSRDVLSIQAMMRPIVDLLQIQTIPNVVKLLFVTKKILLVISLKFS